MGKDKAEIVFDGETLLLRTAKTLGEFFSPVYVSVREGGTAVPGGLIALPDIFPGCGPLSGLHSALSNTMADRVFLSAVDLPFISGKAAYALFTMSEGYDACIVRHGNGYIEPLFGVYAKSALPIARALLAAGKYRMAFLLERINVRYVADSEIGLTEDTLMNVNTPEELERAKSKL